jgi:hypothetical protein
MPLCNDYKEKLINHLWRTCKVTRRSTFIVSSPLLHLQYSVPKPGGFKCAGKLKKACNVNYGLGTLSLLQNHIYIIVLMYLLKLEMFLAEQGGSGEEEWSGEQ